MIRQSVRLVFDRVSDPDAKAYPDLDQRLLLCRLEKIIIRVRILRNSKKEFMDIKI